VNDHHVFLESGISRVFLVTEPAFGLPLGTLFMIVEMAIETAFGFEGHSALGTEEGFDSIRYWDVGPAMGGEAGRCLETCCTVFTFVTFLEFQRVAELVSLETV